MSVRAKFRVGQIKDVQLTHHYKPDGSFVNEPITAKSISMYIVSDGSPENRSFFASTPGGTVELTTVNPKAAEQFIEGKEYYADFTPA